MTGQQAAAERVNCDKLTCYVNLDLTKSSAALNAIFNSTWMLLQGRPVILSIDTLVPWPRSQSSPKGASTVSCKSRSMTDMQFLQGYRTILLFQNIMQWPVKLLHSHFCVLMGSQSQKSLRIYSPDQTNAVGTEYILLERLEGTPLSD